VLKQAHLFAQRVKESVPNDPAGQIDLAYRLAVSRSPTEREREIARGYLANGHDLEGLAHVLLNTNEFAYLR
jgi:hypothetical protein